MKQYLHKFAALATAAMIAASAFGVTQTAFAQSDVGGDLGLTTINASAGLGTQNIYQTVGYFIKVALRFVGVIVIILVIYGGFKWMTAGGSEEKVEEAKKILYSAAIGAVIVFSAYALTTFVLGSVLDASGATKNFTGY